MNMTDAANDLVERARLGDQNAMGVITLIGQEARKEEKSHSRIRSRIAYEAIRRAIRATSPKMNGEDVPPPKSLLKGVTDENGFKPCIARLARFKDGLCAAIVALVHGPKLTNARIDEMAGESPLARNALRSAQGMQAYRAGKANTRALGYDVAWEMGE